MKVQMGSLEDHAAVVGITGLFIDAIDVLPKETDRPGISSQIVYALMRAAGHLIAACPVERRGQVIESAQNYLMQAAVVFGEERDRKKSGNLVEPTSGVDPTRH